MMTAAALIKGIIAFCIISFPFYGKESYYSVFSPPHRWELTAPDCAPSRVKVTFAKKSSSVLPPSLNLAEEPVKDSIDLPGYLKAVQAIHSSNKHRWRNLGTFQTKAGTASLTEIDMETAVGAVRILQLVFLKDQTVHLLTGAALKEEFSKYRTEFLNSFRSFTLIHELTDLIDQPEKKETLHQKIATLLSKKPTFNDPSFQKKEWSPFQKFLSKEFSEEGPYWQFLILASTQKKLLSSTF